MIHYPSQVDVALRDSLALEGARTPDQFSNVCRDIEARHAVEGIGERDLEAYEVVKRQHALRIGRMILA